MVVPGLVYRKIYNDSMKLSVEVVPFRSDSTVWCSCIGVTTPSCYLDSDDDNESVTIWAGW